MFMLSVIIYRRGPNFCQALMVARPCVIIAFGIKYLFQIVLSRVSVFLPTNKISRVLKIFLLFTNNFNGVASCLFPW